MKVLLDNNVPAYLLDLFESHQATTAFREGWHEHSNGKLLTEAESHGFEVLVTMDAGFQYQQNLAGLKIGIAILRPTGQQRASVILVCEHLLQVLEGIAPGEVVSIQEPR